MFGLFKKKKKKKKEGGDDAEPTTPISALTATGGPPPPPASSSSSSAAAAAAAASEDDPPPPFDAFCEDGTRRTVGAPVATVGSLPISEAVPNDGRTSSTAVIPADAGIDLGLGVQETRMTNITVPEGAAPGDIVEITAPEGVQVRAEVHERS